MKIEERGMMMLLSELAQKEFIQVDDGIRYGLLADTDLIFNGKTGEIIGLEVKKKFGRFSFKSRAGAIRGIYSVGRNCINRRTSNFI